MSEAESAKVLQTVMTYLQALGSVAGHVASRLKFIRLGYERVTARRELPSPVRSVLFLCRGNICRSPLAEAYFAAQVRQQNQSIVVRSAGLETTPGKPAHALAKEVALEHGMSLDRHATTSLYQDLIHAADLVMVMEVSQKDRVVRLYPQVKSKIFVLGQFCRKGSWDIDDPYGGTTEDFRVCFDRIRDSCDRVLQEIGRAATLSQEDADSGCSAESPAPRIP